MALQDTVSGRLVNGRHRRTTMRLEWGGEATGVRLDGSSRPELALGLLELLEVPGQRQVALGFADASDRSAAIAWLEPQVAALDAAATTHRRWAVPAVIGLLVAIVALAPLAHAVGVYDRLPTSLLIMPVFIAIGLWLLIRAERGDDATQRALALAWLASALRAPGEPVAAPRQAIVGPHTITASALVLVPRTEAPEDA